jgi:hypothetical protein
VPAEGQGRALPRREHRPEARAFDRLVFQGRDGIVVHAATVSARHDVHVTADRFRDNGHMKTRALMSLSAVFLAILGVGATFLPQEVLAHVGGRAEGTSVLLIQVLGALYLGFAMLNWMNRGNRIGGIYARAVSMANLLHFAAGGAALLKGLSAGPLAYEIVALAAIYTVFGIWFGIVVFTHPADAIGTGMGR